MWANTWWTKSSRLLWSTVGRKGSSVELDLGHIGFFSSRGALRHAVESRWRWMAFTAVTVAIDGSSWCSILLHALPRPYQVGKAFLLHLGDALRVQWTLTLGFITLATRDMNNSYALRELACNLLNSHKCLNVFHSKDLSLWDLVKSGNTFSDASVINENCLLKKILQLCLYQWALLSWQIYTPLFH